MLATLEILIIDDDELDRMAIVRALKQSTLQVNITQAKSASEGLLLAGTKSFDLFILDYRLPDVDGIDLLKILRKVDYSQAAIVMISSQDDDMLAERAIEEGAQDFLLKDEVSARRLSRAVLQARYRYGLELKLKQSRAELRQLAEHDALTGLTNRYDFERALHMAVARVQREDGHLAVLLLDIDKFKMVNDTFGHAVGDQLLIEVAHRLQQVVRDSDVLARLGGDEFVVLAQGMDTDEQAILLANRMVDSFVQPMLFGNTEWQVTTSIGIATFGEHTNNAVDLLKNADIAMYRAKQEGRNQSHFYSEALHQAVREKASLERDLRRALKNKEFEVYYQAQINSKDGSLAGFEALVRWNHPLQGLLAPGAFIAKAMEMGLMGELGQWVMRTACMQLHDWRLKFPGNKLRVAVAVNLSAVELQGKNLLEVIGNVLAESKLEPGMLELEITENALIKDTENTAQVLSEIAALGIQLSLDDFGTGFSSFEHLKLFPIHALKIDRSFVASVGQNIAQERLLAAMMRFAQTLGLKVVAEGVETLAQAEFCRENGCDFLQGYYYSKPLPVKEFEMKFLLHNGVA